MSQPFRFKQFQVSDHKSSMKVGTDAVLLGAWANPPQTGNILDVGTGCGVIALMMAQKSAASITAIDIHEPSVRQAAENFRISPWPDRLKARQSDMETFSGKHQGCFDYIVSNPPFFVDSLKPRKQNLVIAKHAGKKFLGSFFDSIANLLCPQGAAAFIFPSQMMGQIVIKMIESEFLPVRITNIISKPNAQVSRVMIEIAREIPEKTSKDQLIIRDTDDRYTEEYKNLTGDFYLFLNE